MTSVLLPKASLLAGGTPRVSQHKPRAGYRSSIKPKAKQALCVCQAEGREEADPGSDSSQQVRVRALLTSMDDCAQTNTPSMGFKNQLHRILSTGGASEPSLWLLNGSSSRASALSPQQKKSSRTLTSPTGYIRLLALKQGE